MTQKETKLQRCYQRNWNKRPGKIRAETLLLIKCFSTWSKINTFLVHLDLKSYLKYSIRRPSKIMTLYVSSNSFKSMRVSFVLCRITNSTYILITVHSDLLANQFEFPILSTSESVVAEIEKTDFRSLCHFSFFD